MGDPWSNHKEKELEAEERQKTRYLHEHFLKFFPMLEACYNIYQSAKTIRAILVIVASLAAAAGWAAQQGWFG